MIKKIKKYIPIVLFVIFFVSGLGIMLYPVLSNAISESKYDNVIDNYENTVKEDPAKDYSSLFQRAYDYNERLTTSTIVDVFSDPTIKVNSDYLQILNLDNEGTMGYISIPKIDVKIPIYHGTSAETLQKGVGHLEGSSFPVGGDTTHAILSAHRGLPSARLFTDLDQLENGDMFYIHVLDQVLAYEVDQVLVIEPSETEALQLQEGEDYVTLVTCTPYGVNTHRLLVRGTRVEYQEEVQENTEVEKKLNTSDLALYVGLGFGIGILVSTLFIVVGTSKKPKKKKKHLDNKY